MIGANGTYKKPWSRFCATKGAARNEMTLPLMVICFLVGLLYLVVFYIAGSQVPIMRDLSNLVNIAIGFGFIIVGFVLSTK